MKLALLPNLPLQNGTSAASTTLVQ